MKPEYLPLTHSEIKKKGWSSVDVVLVTGDAYVDHPSFGVAIIARVLEAAGFSVAILSQPDWHSKEDFQRFGRPNLFFGITSGNMDSMVNKYTSLRKVRNDDAYSEGELPFRRPDRATIVYAHRAREACRGVPIILGGVEASLRRFAHYDYWSDSVRHSILIDSKADLLVFGMGERQILEIARRLKSGQSIEKIRDVRGTTFCLGEREAFYLSGTRTLPSFEEVVRQSEKFSLATKIIHEETNPYNARPLLQYHGKRAIVSLPPALPLDEREMDEIYMLPFTRAPHPVYTKTIPAYEMIKNSVTILRGCFGGCSFCSIALHQGRIVQSRSEGSVLAEARKIRGTVSDLGGPTANMYRMGCAREKALTACRRLSCLYPTVCKNLNTDHESLIELMRKVRCLPGIKHVFVSSGIRMDLALLSPEYIREIAHHHTSGHLKVAPEHVSRHVLDLMRKPSSETFEQFATLFTQYSKEAGKRQYLIPYIISAHPGSRIEDEVELALFLKKWNFRPRQIQDFLPSPMDIATSMYYTGIDPYSGKRIVVTKGEGEKRLHRALIQFFKKEKRSLVRKMLSNRVR
jgi:uncharacterized radical SAM protein YgiQ